MSNSIPLPADALAALTAQYDIMGEIGRGAMGTVYLAQERLLQRRVAVKVLPAAASLDAEARARFLREARTAARLHHPNIVPLHSFLEAGNSLLYIMGYIEGESLGHLLEREGRLQAVAARRILDDVADALGYAHSQGVIHRDVKPDNILIETSTGRAFLADFGVAREIAGGDTLTHAGMVVGTPHYMSPEQAGGGVVDARSDLYSLGIIGYQMVSGRLPFGGSTVREVLSQRMTSEPEAVGALMPETPDDLAIAVTKALRREPADRWKDAAALRASLQLDAERAPVLPDTLESLPSFGTRLLGVHAGIGLVCSVLYFWERDAAWLAVAMAPPVATFTMLPAMFLHYGKKEGYGWRRVLRLFFWAPERWTSWWPKRLRRPGDVWNRLPRQVRGFRVAMSASAAAFLAITAPPAALFFLLSISGEDARAAKLLSALLPWGLVIPAVATIVSYTAVGWTYVWKKRYGLNAHLAQKLLTEPVVSAFWKRPEITPLLGDAVSAIPVAPQTPNEMADAIAATVAQLPEPLRDVLGDAVRLAREAAVYAGRIHRELADLAQELDPVERQKLEQRLVELTSSQDGGRTQLRELVGVQIRMLDDLEQRRLVLADAHEKIERGLRHIWHQMSALRGGQLDGKLDEAEITGRLRALCSDLRLHQEAADEVTHVLAASPVGHEAS